MPQKSALTARQLVIRYSLFALLAMAINIGLQRLILAQGETTPFYTAAVIAGTAAGLVVKYILDKKWIFFDTTREAKGVARQFSNYTLVGGITTLIFWAMETAAWLLTKDHGAREVGAVVGLSIGYFVKYYLDKQFVFKRIG